MFRYYLLGGDTVAPSGLYARLWRAFIVYQTFTRCRGISVAINACIHKTILHSISECESKE